MLCISVSLLLMEIPPLYAQPEKFSSSFQEKLDALQLDVFLPLDSDYRTYPLASDAFQEYDYHIQSRKERMEIQFLAIPYQENKPGTHYPHIMASRTATHMATNAEDAPITLLSLGTKELEEFNADWGVIYFFTPKSQVSGRNHGELVALHKEDRGTAMIFFFFDDPDNPAIDYRFYSVQFQ